MTSDHMEGRTRTWLLLPFLAVIAIIVALFATWAFWMQFPPWMRQLAPYYIPGDYEFFYVAKAVISSVNAAILIFLIFTYYTIYRKTRSAFTIGLLIFAIVFLLYALASNPLIVLAFGFQMFGLGPFALLPDVFTLAALMVLVYLSFKY